MVVAQLEIESCNKKMSIYTTYRKRTLVLLNLIFPSSHKLILKLPWWNCVLIMVFEHLSLVILYKEVKWYSKWSCNLMPTVLELEGQLWAGQGSLQMRLHRDTAFQQDRAGFRVSDTVYNLPFFSFLFLWWDRQTLLDRKPWKVQDHLHDPSLSSVSPQSTTETLI